MTNANDSAFSTPASEYDGMQVAPGKGLTKREYFAAMVISAFISHPLNGNPININGNAQHAVAQADALINELNKLQS